MFATTSKGNLGQKSRRQLYTLFASLAVIVIIIGAFLLPQALSLPQSFIPSQTASPTATIPANSSNGNYLSVTPSPTEQAPTTNSQISTPSVSPCVPQPSNTQNIVVSPGFGLNYSVGDHMVYYSTAIGSAQQSDLPNLTGTPSTTNSSYSLDVISFDGENYSITQTISATIGDQTINAPLNLNVRKTDCYKNLFIGADILLNSSKATVLPFMDKSTGKIGESLTFPVSTGNASYGLTGEITLTIQGIQDVTVPSGTYKCIRIDISSNTLTMHADPNYLSAIHLAPFDKSTVQMNGTTYLEQSTFRLIKSAIIQYGIVETIGSTGSSTTVASTISMEKTLIEYTKAK